MNELKIGDIRKFTDSNDGYPSIGVVIEVHKAYYIICDLNGAYLRIFKGMKNTSVKLSKEIRNILIKISSGYKRISKITEEQKQLEENLNNEVENIKDLKNQLVHLTNN